MFSVCQIPHFWFWAVAQALVLWSGISACDLFAISYILSQKKPCLVDRKYSWTDFKTISHSGSLKGRDLILCSNMIGNALKSSSQDALISNMPIQQRSMILVYLMTSSAVSGKKWNQTKCPVYGSGELSLPNWPLWRIALSLFYHRNIIVQLLINYYLKLLEPLSPREQFLYIPPILLFSVHYCVWHIAGAQLIK